MDLSADRIIDTLNAATEENLQSGLRKGQVINLPAEGDMLLAGDLHDHRRNFDKLLKYADLEQHPTRHLVLQEIIHGDHYDPSGCEESWVTLLRAAELKADRPEQVHFLMANHDLAQIHGEGIMKAGLSVCEAFNKGVKKAFAPHHHQVQVAITEFFLSLPLAVRCPNGVFCCHSMPTDALMEQFDFTVFDRALTGPDYVRRTGPVYQLIWGRNTSATAVDLFAEKVGAKLIVTGHQPQDSGFARNGEKNLIIASDHNQGVFLTVDLARSEYDLTSLVQSLQKFVAIDV